MDYDDMLEAVKLYFSDMSRSAADTKDGLEQLQEEVATLIECLERDER